MNPITVSLLLPLAGALIILLLDRHPGIRDGFMVAVAGATFGAVAMLVGPVAAGQGAEFNLVEFLPGLPLGFHLEPLGMLFALVASGLWIVTSLYSIGYMRSHDEIHQTRFHACFALAICAALGIAYSRNVLTLFVFYELLTLSTYPLVTHQGTEEARRAGKIYLGILLSTSVGLLLLGMIWTWIAAGTLEFTPGGILAGKVSSGAAAVLLGLYAFGAGKAALMPFHRWLPAAMVAPTPVSALLHAVAVVKAGVFTILKITVYVFGLDFLAGNGAGVWLMYAAAVTMIGASLTAMTLDNLKRRLAYSTISQLAYIVLGAMLANSFGALGGGLHILMHAFGKITLFFCAGAIYVASGKTRVSELDGLGRKMPFTFAAFALAAISIIGLPPMGGTWSKWYLVLGAVEAHQLPLVAAFLLSSLLNIAYLLPVPIRGFLSGRDQAGLPQGLVYEGGGPDAHSHDIQVAGMHEAPILCVVPLCLTAAGCVVLFFFADAVVAFLKPAVGL
jgi:multicomponent Na+:H+ antiporter subunit D